MSSQLATVKDVPAVQARAIAQAVLSACKAYYTDPANLAAFERWKASRIDKRADGK